MSKFPVFRPYSKRPNFSSTTDQHNGRPWRFSLRQGKEKSEGLRWWTKADVGEGGRRVGRCDVEDCQDTRVEGVGVDPSSEVKLPEHTKVARVDLLGLIKEMECQA